MWFVSGRLKLNEHDQKCEEHERLDQREGDDHERLHGAGGTRVAGGTFSGTRTDEALSDTGQTGSEAEADTAADGLCGTYGRFVIGGTRTTRLSGSDHRQKGNGDRCVKHVFHFVHFDILLS